MDEFLQAIRFDGGVSEEQIGDKHVQQLFAYIDTDKSGDISLSEFLTFVSTTTRKRPRLPRSGILVRENLLTHREREVLAAREAERLEGVPFIAEYIAVERIPLRETHQPDSKIIGYLNANEVVAVTKVWEGNRMKCHRLTVGASPSEGWCSHRGRNKGGRLTVLLSRLTRQEWTSVSSHETSVAHRVATLRHMESIMNNPAVKHERLLREKRMGPDYQPTAHKADRWVSELLEIGCEDPDDKEPGAEDPKAVAVDLLSRCKTDHELSELLGVMERTHRAEWSRVGTAWLEQHQQMQERVAAAAQQCLQRRQHQEWKRQQQPIPPAPNQTFASIDRALKIRQIAQSKRQIMSMPTGGSTERRAAGSFPVHSEVVSLAPVVIQTHAERSASALSLQKEKETAIVESEDLQNDPTDHPNIDSDISLQRAAQSSSMDPVSSWSPSASADSILVPQETAGTEDQIGTSSHQVAPSDAVLTTSIKRSIGTDGSPAGARISVAAADGQSVAKDSCLSDDRSSSCANVLWRAPQTLPCAESARCLDPPPRAGISLKAQRLHG